MGQPYDPLPPKDLNSIDSHDARIPHSINHRAEHSEHRVSRIQPTEHCL